MTETGRTIWTSLNERYVPDYDEESENNCKTIFKQLLPAPPPSFDVKDVPILIKQGYEFLVYAVVKQYLPEKLVSLVAEWIDTIEDIIKEIDLKAKKELLGSAAVEFHGGKNWVVEKFTKNPNNTFGEVLFNLIKRDGVRCAELVFVEMLRIFLVRHGVVGIAVFLVAFSTPSVSASWRVKVQYKLFEEAIYQSQACCEIEPISLKRKCLDNSS